MIPTRFLCAVLLATSSAACSSKWVRVGEPDRFLSFEVPADWKIQRLDQGKRRYRKAEKPEGADMFLAVEDTRPPIDPAKFLRSVLKEVEFLPGEGQWTTRTETRPGHESPSVNVFMEGAFTILGSTWQVRSRSWILDNANVAVVATYAGKSRTEEGDAMATRMIEAAGPGKN